MGSLLVKIIDSAVLVMNRLKNCALFRTVFLNSEICIPKLSQFNVYPDYSTIVILL